MFFFYHGNAFFFLRFISRWVCVCRRRIFENLYIYPEHYLIERRKKENAEEKRKLYKWWRCIIHRAREMKRIQFTILIPFHPSLRLVSLSFFLLPWRLVWLLFHIITLIWCRTIRLLIHHITDSHRKVGLGASATFVRHQILVEKAKFVWNHLKHRHANSERFSLFSWRSAKSFIIQRCVCVWVA